MHGDPTAWEHFLEHVRAAGIKVPLPENPPSPNPIDVLRSRAQRCVTQEGAARLMGVDLSTWRSWERGSVKMPSHHWIRWQKMVAERM